ncbi:SixA phosphatase family protein [Streptomyces nitrosporeus]|uniref:Histidine phosphatase family protein n=1 Tax=Streptomyces nitrosporeus TaxID=28894 RepID=A0A5J6FGP7_9ACTN|nr:histidine phosphatase family protein [Streptomyces nitrosporeus]QEU75186.1 histidine phosphatase family protein [Streptomyces nitrosporeus]GGZ29284.1 phosphohistidine phosphatase [Streptomyces nitrosporeus]
MSAETPRRIVLLRHAKAEWSQQSDHERPLAERGRKDAPVAGRRLADSGIAFGLALCSTAARTRETWKLAVHEFPRRPRTVYEERLYEASVGELIALFNEVSDDIRDLLVIGHNPGVHGVADTLAGRAEGDALTRMTRDGFSTAAYAVVEFPGTWKSLEPGVGKLAEYWTPNG